VSAKSWPEQHPWMTFFLAAGTISAVVTIIRGYKPAPQRSTIVVPDLMTAKTSGVHAEGLGVEIGCEACL